METIASIQQQCVTVQCSLHSGLAVQPSQVAQGHQNLVDDSACSLGSSLPAQRLRMARHEAHDLAHTPYSVGSDARPAAQRRSDCRSTATTPSRLHGGSAADFCGLGANTAITASSSSPLDLQRSGERRLSGQQGARAERGVVWQQEREFEKEQEVRSGLCTWNTEAENRGRDLGCAREPAQLSGEAAAVKGKLGGTAQAGW